MFKNKKGIFNSIKFIVMVAVFAIGISYLGFQSPEKILAKNIIGGITPPPVSGCVTQGSSGSDICTPLDEGPTNEVKTGGLSVGGFIAQGDSQVVAGPMSLGKTGSSSTLTVSGNDMTSGNVKIESLGGVSGITYPAPVCASSVGQLYLCGTTPPAPPTPVVTNNTSE